MVNIEQRRARFSLLKWHSISRKISIQSGDRNLIYQVSILKELETQRKDLSYSSIEAIKNGNTKLINFNNDNDNTEKYCSTLVQILSNKFKSSSKLFISRK